MASVNAEVELPASAEKVWAVLSDLHRFDEWLTIHAGWSGDIPSELIAGTKLTEKVMLLGMANKIEWTVDAFDAPSLVKMSGSGMAGVKVGLSIAVTSTGDTSTATIETMFEGQMVVGALGKAVEKDAKKNLDESMAKLASLVA
jgi:carbon monoxide dehydrogenase subunit G